MSIELTKIENHDPYIESHEAWYGKITGLAAEDKLQGQPAYTYLLREGEYEFNYYISFTLPDRSIKHQPFCIRLSPNGWFCRNGTGTGPFIQQTIREIVHVIMHCKQEECKPLNRFL